MTAQAGIHFLLKKGKKDENPQTIAGMRTTKMVLNNELIDITHKDSMGARHILNQAGMQSISLKAAGIFTNSAVEEEVRYSAFAKEVKTYSLFFPNGDILEGDFYITHYERAGDYNGEEIYSLQLESAAHFTYTKKTM